MSSMHLGRTCANSSLTSMPLWPYFLNLNGDANAAPVLRSVGRLRAAAACRAYLSSSGLGSNVSTCDGPPFMNRWTTRLALAGKGASLGQERVCRAGDRGHGEVAAGLASAPAAAVRDAMPASASMARDRRRPPIPMPERQSSSRRVMTGVFEPRIRMRHQKNRLSFVWQPAPIGSRRFSRSIDEHEFIGAATGPGLSCSQGESCGSLRPLTAAAGVPGPDCSRMNAVPRRELILAREVGRARGDRAGGRVRPTDARLLRCRSASSQRPAAAPARAGTGCSSGTGPAGARS